MAYLTIAHFSGDPDRLVDQYRGSSKIMDEVGRDHGLILHAGAKTGTGLLVVNLWPSKNGSEAAAADPRRLAALERAAVMLDKLQREHYEVDRYVVSPGQEPQASKRQASTGRQPPH